MCSGEPGVEAEVVGFREDCSLLMALGDMRGIGPGDPVVCAQTQQMVAVGRALIANPSWARLVREHHLEEIKAYDSAMLEALV